MGCVDWVLDWNAVLAISTALMSIAIILTAIYAAIQLQHIKKARYSAILMELHKMWDSDEYVKSRSLISRYSGDRTSKKLIKDFSSFEEKNSEEFFLLTRLANFFENLGYSVCEGHIDRKQAITIFGDAAKRYWLLLDSYVRFYRNKTQPNVWVYFEYLANGCIGRRPDSIKKCNTI